MDGNSGSTGGRILVVVPVLIVVVVRGILLGVEIDVDDGVDIGVDINVGIEIPVARPVVLLLSTILDNGLDNDIGVATVIGVDKLVEWDVDVDFDFDQAYEYDAAIPAFLIDDIDVASDIDFAFANENIKSRSVGISLYLATGRLVAVVSFVISSSGVTGLPSPSNISATSYRGGSTGDFTFTSNALGCRGDGVYGVCGRGIASLSLKTRPS